MGNMLVRFIPSLHKLVSFGKNDPQLRKCLLKFALTASLWEIYLAIICFGQARPTVDYANPGQEVLSCITIQAGKS